MSEPGPFRRASSVVLWTLAALLLFAAVATARAVLDGEREIAQSDAAFDANDLHGAIQHARRAASAYAPFAPHVERGYARLRAIARGAEASARPEIATLAYQAQRAAVLESASLLRPFPERLEEANRNLARLTAVRAGPEPARAQVAKRLFEAAEERDPERFPLGALLAAGLMLSALGVAWFARAALGGSGRVDWLRGKWGLVAFALGVGLWALGAYRG